MVQLPVETGSARRQKTRDRLLDAAYDVFADVGVDAAPVELIVERAGFTRGAFYSNFESKADLFKALAERENSRRLEMVHEGVRSVLPNAAGRLAVSDADKLEIITEAVAGFLKLQGDDRHWCLIESEFRIQALRSDEFGSYFADYSDTLTDRLAEMLDEMIGMLGFRLIVEPTTFAHTIVATYHSCVEKRLMAGADKPPHEDTEVQRLIASLISVMTERKPR